MGEEGLSPDWIITPVGGSDKVPTFVALIGAQGDLNIALLIDFQKRDQQKIENLYKGKLLKKKQVLTYANYVTNDEADVEDMFEPEFYLKLVNGAFESCLTVDDLPTGPPRIVRRVEQYLADNSLPSRATFTHYRPAHYFSTNIDSLATELTEQQLERWRQAFAELNALL